MGYKLTTPNLLTVIVLLCLVSFTSTTAFSEVLELSPTQDTYVNSRKSNSTYNSSKYIRVLETRRSQRQGLMKFDLSDIAPGSKIEKAELWLYVAYNRGSGILTVSEILQDWDESVNWNNKPEVSGLAEDSADVRRRGMYYKFDLTNLSQDWVDGVVENNGIHIGLENSAYIIINSENNSANRPKLKVTYSEPEPDTSADTTSEPDSDPVNTVQPHPNPEPEPEPEPVGDTGVSDAPLSPANKRMVVVSQDGSGDYTKIQDAVEDSRPGDTIQVKDGIYVERVQFSVSGTKQEPITLKNYPNHSPVIDPGGGHYPPECCHPKGTPRVQVNAQWIIIEGFEIRNGWDGIKVYNSNVTIRDNWIHNNKYQGILIVSVGDVFIEGNTINNNGTDPGACSREDWGGESPTHCHAIYISDYSCDGAPRITVRGNVLRNHGGGGVHWNGSGCSSSMGGNLLENNMIEDNTWGMMLFYNVRNSVIRNNTFVTENLEQDYNSSYSFISIWGSTGNQIKNNIFYSTKDEISAIMIRDSESTQNTFDYNLWNVSFDWWVWDGDWRDDFHADFKSVTGWGQNSWCCSVNPDFVSSSQKNYRIRSSSPAVDTGTSQECASIDYDGQQRAHGQSCDMGADEFM